MEPAQRSRIAQKTFALALGALLAPLVAEGGFRVWRALDGKAFEADASVTEIETLNRHIQGVEFMPTEPEVKEKDPTRAGKSLHPYLGFQVLNYFKSRDNSRAYWKSPEAAANFDILLLGGSVAAQVVEFWPKDFQPLLTADPRFAEHKVRMIWRACPGHKQPQHAIDLQWALSLGDAPDLVLLIDGFNELAVAAHNAESGVHPLFPMWTEMEAQLSGAPTAQAEIELLGDLALLRRSAKSRVDTATRYGLMHSAILGSFVQRGLANDSRNTDRVFGELLDLRAKSASGRPPFIAGPPFPNDAQSIRELSIEAWVQGSRTMHAACAARGIRFVHVLQPAACDLESKPLSVEEQESSREPKVWREAVENGYPLLREKGLELVKEGEDILDASDVFQGHTETIYRDPCHFGEAGHALFAKRIADHLLRVLPEKL